MKTNLQERFKLKDLVLKFLEERKLTDPYHSIKDSILIEVDPCLTNLIQCELLADGYIEVNRKNNKLVSITHDGSKFIENGGYHEVCKNKREEKYKWKLPLILTSVIIIISIISLIMNNKLKNSNNDLKVLVSKLDTIISKGKESKEANYKKFINLKKNMEGTWVETYKDRLSQTSISGIAFFEVDTISGNITFHGNAYEHGKWVGTWYSECSVLNGKTFTYAYKGNSDKDTPIGKVRIGNGEINFLGKIGVFESGNGFYMANQTDKKKRYFDIYKLKKEDEQNLTLANLDKTIKIYQQK